MGANARPGMRAGAVALLILAFLALYGILVSPASAERSQESGPAIASAAQAQPTDPPTTPTPTTAAPTTTQRPTTTRPPQTTQPPPQTTQATSPPETQDTTPEVEDTQPEEETQPVEEDEDQEEAGAIETARNSGPPITTANLLVPGDGTQGSESTTTTRPGTGGSEASDEDRMIWMVIVGLGAVALLVALLTWRYWMLTRPGLDLADDEDDFDDDGYGASPGPQGWGEPNRALAAGPGGPGGPGGFGDPGPPTAAHYGGPDGDPTMAATAFGAPGGPGGPGGPDPTRAGGGGGWGDERDQRTSATSATAPPTRGAELGGDPRQVAIGVPDSGAGGGGAGGAGAGAGGSRGRDGGPSGVGFGPGPGAGAGGLGLGAGRPGRQDRSGDTRGRRGEPTRGRGDQGDGRRSPRRDPAADEAGRGGRPTGARRGRPPADGGRGGRGGAGGDRGRGRGLPPGSPPPDDRRGRSPRRENAMDRDDRRRGDPFGWADAAAEPPQRGGRGGGGGSGRGRDEGRGDRGRPPGGEFDQPDDGWSGDRRADDRSVRDTGAWGRPPRRR